MKENIELTEIEIMFYDDRYLRYSQFPKEIVVHFCNYFRQYTFFVMK